MPIIYWAEGTSAIQQTEILYMKKEKDCLCCRSRYLRVSLRMGKPTVVGGGPIVLPPPSILLGLHTRD